MSQYLLIPKMVNLYAKDFNKIVQDLLEVLEETRKPEKHYQVEDIEEVLFKWAFECTAKFVLGMDTGVLKGHMPEESKAFIKNVQDYLSLSAETVREPPFLRSFLETRSWKAASKAHNTLLQIGAKIIETRMKEIDGMTQQELESMERYDFLTYMLTSGGLKMSTIAQNTADLLFAGTDTISYTLLLTLYCIGTHQDVQSRLREEINTVLGDSTSVTLSHIKNLKFLKNCIRESQRLYPIVSSLTRVTTEDVVLSGYHVPAGTMVIVPTYACSRHLDNFSQPDDFNPDRWLAKDVSKFASLPFSFGARACIGRRVADLEMRITLAHIIRRFQVSYLDPQPISIGGEKLFQLPNKPVPIGLKDLNA